MKRVLIISHDKIGTQMAGTGIRYHYMGEVLSADSDVTVGFFDPTYLPDDKFERSYNVLHVDAPKFYEAFAEADIIIAFWLNEAMIQYCNDHNKILIIDIYAPAPVENLALKVYSGKAITEADEFAYQSSLKDYRKFLQNADRFLYSNRRQLDFWMGFSIGADQITPSSFLKRNVYEQFLSAPMGIDTEQELVPTAPMYKGVLKGVAKDDIVMVWNGGIYDWYDGVTLVDAMEIVGRTNPEIKLIFPGTEHPNKTLPKWQETIDTKERAKTLGVIDKNVFFFNSWIDYHARVGFLLEADIGIYTHKPSIESEFSHRTRVLDHILAKLPTIATKGDFFADVVEANDIGLTVPAYDKKTLADAIIELSKPHNLKRAQANIEKLRPSFDWTETLAPLSDYIAEVTAKDPQITPLKVTPLQNKRLAFAKRHTPLPVKKAIIKVTPKSIKKRLLR